MPDYTVGDTVYKRFTSRAFASGIPTTLAGSPVCSAYEDDSATQITAGITLGVDHDSVTGLNLLTIVATGANGFEAGKSYDIVITTGTVGGVSVVGEVVWHFTLSAEAAAVDLANGTDGLGAIKGDTAAILIDTTGLNGDAMRGTDSAALASVATEGRLAELDAGNLPTDVAAVKSDTAAILVDTTGLNGDAMRGTDSAALASVATEARLAELDAANLPADVDAILADTNELQTDWANAGRLDAILDARASQATADAIETDTQDIQSRIPAALVGGRIDATVDGTGMETGAIDAILQRQITEAYNVDGAAPTVEQALTVIMQGLTEFAISGTTISVKKLDGSTEAMTFTLDDATDPTSRTRAT